MTPRSILVLLTGIGLLSACSPPELPPAPMTGAPSVRELKDHLQGQAAQLGSDSADAAQDFFMSVGEATQAGAQHVQRKLTTLGNTVNTAVDNLTPPAAPAR